MLVLPAAADAAIEPLIAVPESLNTTVPDGWPPAVPVTVAIKVIIWFCVLGLGELERLNVVAVQPASALRAVPKTQKAKSIPRANKLRRFLFFIVFYKRAYEKRSFNL